VSKFSVNVQLNVDGRSMPLPDAAYLWFDVLTESLTGAERAQLADLPAVGEMAADGSGPKGAPGSLFGVIEVERSINGASPTTQRRVLSREGFGWLHDQLADLPRKTTVWIGHLDADGQRGGKVLRAIARPPKRSPGWVVLEAEIPADRFTDPVTGPAEQRRWLTALDPIADRVDPGFGQISYWLDGGRTPLERWSVARDFPPDQRDPQYSIARNRDRLRGYAWLTILSQEVADKVGGPRALTATGAFAEVKELSHGGLWLLATPDFTEYNMKSAEAVYGALAPALGPGTPMRREGLDDPPLFVVLADPSASS
jgi:hypothetical protein